MAPRGVEVLQVTFGPSKSPLASRAVSYARAHAEEASEVSPGVWRASFVLGADERAFGMASTLLQMVLGWRSTTVEVDHSPEPPWVMRQMLVCAREWLRSTGACRAWFPTPSGHLQPLNWRFQEFVNELQPACSFASRTGSTAPPALLRLERRLCLSVMETPMTRTAGPVR